MRMFVAVSQYQVAEETIAAHSAAHRSWVEGQYLRGRLLVSGRRSPPEGGVLVGSAADGTDVRALLDSDPFSVRGIATWRVVEFDATHFPCRSREFDTFAALHDAVHHVPRNEDSP
ncbi:MAG: hypothetical protein QOH72_1406 [Solirubrobacteraceae bacterium]|jgi:uncharacterized protein YciI|nr:hypothetical protein [Solirubrobacteraceae bacterium]